LFAISQKYRDTSQEELSAFYCCPRRGFRDKSEIQSLLHTTDIENHFINTYSSFSAVLLEFILIASFDDALKTLLITSWNNFYS